MKVKFLYDEPKFKLFDEKIISKWIFKVSGNENKIVDEINYRFVSEEEILNINTEFLNHNYYTDIITFDESLVNIIKGDIVISIETIRTNARKLNCEFTSELHRVIVHGIMHLCGYKDYTPEEKSKMRQLEEKYLAYLD